MANLWGSMDSQQAVNMGLGFLQSSMQMMQQKQAMEQEKQKIEFLKKSEAQKFKLDLAKLKLEQDRAKNEQNKLNFLLKQIQAETELTKEKTKTVGPESTAQIEALKALKAQRLGQTEKDVSKDVLSFFINKEKEGKSELKTQQTELKNKKNEILRLMPKEEREKLTPEKLQEMALNELALENFNESTALKGPGGGIVSTTTRPGQGPAHVQSLNRWKEQADFIQHLIKMRGYSREQALKVAKEVFGEIYPQTQALEPLSSILSSLPKQKYTPENPNWFQSLSRKLISPAANFMR